MIVARKKGMSSSTLVATANGSSDEEDEAAELMRELEKIKKERVQQKEKEVGLLSGVYGPANVCRRKNAPRRRKRSANSTLPGAIPSSTRTTLA